MSEQGGPSDKELTTEEREDIRRSLLPLMGAPVPNRARIRESLRDLSQTGIDARAAYELWRNYRPEGFPILPAFDLLMAEPDARAELEWNYYNGTSELERVTRYRDAVRAGAQVVGAAPGVQIVDLEGDVPSGVLSEMAETGSGLAGVIGRSIATIASRAGIEMVFGGFTPAGNHLVLTYEGRTYLNQLAIHGMAERIAALERAPYPDTFSKLLLDILIGEAARLGLSQRTPSRSRPS